MFFIIREWIVVPGRKQFSRFGTFIFFALTIITLICTIYIIAEIRSVESEIDETRQQIASIQNTSYDIFSKIGQLDSKVEKLAPPENIIDKITSADSEIEKIKSEILQIQRDQLRSRAVVSTSAAFSFLGFLHEATIAAIAKTPNLKKDLEKAAIDIAVEFVKKLVGGTAESLGKAFGSWLACGHATCEKERYDVSYAVNDLIERQCEKDCYKLLMNSDDSSRDASFAKIETQIKDGFAASSSSQSRLLEAITKLKSAVPAIEPSHASNFPPMIIYFEKIGSFDDNGQAGLLIPTLKKATENKKGCVISVTGHTDTLGSDKANLALSEKRSDKIIDKLKSAFVDGRVQIKKEEQWGERRLKDWTPNNVAHMANRRVEIDLSCDN